eukprot:m.65074 g.65074  ORF g.65074 m.65074 type:complete len:197 (-) comp13641_c0_seq2:149-739(-)
MTTDTLDTRSCVVLPVSHQAVPLLLLAFVSRQDVRRALLLLACTTAASFAVLAIFCSFSVFKHQHHTVTMKVAAVAVAVLAVVCLLAAETNAARPCGNNGDCGRRKACVAGACAKRCAVDSDCSDPRSCILGTCLRACDDDGDCPGRQTCLFETFCTRPIRSLIQSGDFNGQQRLPLTTTTTTTTPAASHGGCGRR